MSLEPTLLIPAFRYGKETPWGGELLNRMYGKFAVGTKIGESNDFCSESKLPDGRSLLKANLLGDRHPLPPFSLKWVDCAGQQHFHCHPESEEYLYVIKIYSDSHMDVATEDDSIFSYPLQAGDLICIPPSVSHALSGALCIQLTARNFSTLRTDHTPSNIDLKAPNEPIDLLLIPEAINEQTVRLLQANCFSVYELSNYENAFFGSRDDFFLITCLTDGVIRTKEKSFYLGRGQTVLIPPHCSDFKLSGERFLLTSPT